MAERVPFHWEMVEGDYPVPMPESHEEALEMALTLALVCTDSGADEFIEMAEELAAHGIRAAGLITDEDAAALGVEVRTQN